MSVHKYFGMKWIRKSVSDVVGIIDRFGVSTIAIEEPDIVGLKEFKLLRATLEEWTIRSSCNNST